MNDNNKEKWKKVIHIAGACLFSNLDERITHIIVGPLPLGNELVNKVGYFFENMFIISILYL